MNNDRRKRIARIYAELDKLKSKFEDLTAELADIRDEESYAFDAMPENLQESERGQKSAEARDALENAVYELECIDFDSILASIDEAEAA